MRSGGGLILGIESSCDETAAAVVRAGGEVLANVVASQMALHAKYGGVVPELASAANICATSFRWCGRRWRRRGWSLRSWMRLR